MRRPDARIHGGIPARGALALAVLGVCVAACSDAPRSLRGAWQNARHRQHPGRLPVHPDTMPDANPERLPGEVDDDPLPGRAGGADTPHTVVLVVLDTVRADHTSACGYDRPTTPTLTALAAEDGATLRCGAVAPATWTLPTHATLFTGVMPEEHGLLRKGQRLDPRHTTLAEQFGARGYATALFSANPVLNEATGLQRGMDHAESPPRLVSPLRGPALAEHVGTWLDTVPERDVFLTVNVFDAHDPYPPIAAGHPFLPEQPVVTLPTQQRQSTHPFWVFLRGELPASRQEAWLATLTNGYDHGVERADRRLSELLEALAMRGRDAHLRLAVTSDHGEHLGEHGLLRHDGPPWETVARVPLVTWQTGEAVAPLPGPEAAPVSLVALTPWLLDGVWPSPMPTPRSMSIRYAGRVPELPFETAVGLWEGSQDKLLWRESAGAQRFDLGSDPGERRPAQPRVDEAARLASAAARVQRARDAAMDEDADPTLSRLLSELGYVDGAEE